ncbi:MAG: hypothetical protein HQL51_08530 [Magnetococcales bacterium]|nr:hypothetical protein [Magnetococcales bacterium]
MMEFSVTYLFRFGDGTTKEFPLYFDLDSLEVVQCATVEPPEWARLTYHQCAICPLKPEKHPYCPAAMSLAEVVDHFHGLSSHGEVVLEVYTRERAVVSKTTVQRGVASIMGLIMATSGCPHMAFFKPMARFHLPLASEEETVVRAMSTYLMFQLFRRERGLHFDFDLDGLVRIYQNVNLVNKTFGIRLQAASEEDPACRALIVLDAFTTILPDVIDESLEEVRYLFDRPLPALGD